MQELPSKHTIGTSLSRLRRLLSSHSIIGSLVCACAPRRLVERTAIRQYLLTASCNCSCFYSSLTLTPIGFPQRHEPRTLPALLCGLELVAGVGSDCSVLVCAASSPPPCTRSSSSMSPCLSPLGLYGGLLDGGACALRR